MNRIIRRLATTKYTNIISNTQVLNDFSSLNASDYKFYKKSTEDNSSILDDRYMGLFFMPVNTTTNKDIFKKELYALEIHSFYHDEPENILEKLYPNIYKNNKTSRDRKLALRYINEKLDSLPRIKSLMYIATYKNISNTVTTVKFGQPIITHVYYQLIPKQQVISNIFILIMLK